MKTMLSPKKLALSALALAAAFGAAPAFAQEAGDVQVKVLGSFVLPDGELRSASGPIASALPAGVDTKADDNFVPTLAVEYFVAPNVSLETICCVTQHDVSATAPAALAGAELVSNAQIIPATLTVKYHFNPGGSIRPYVGAGPTYFFFFNDKPGAGARAALGADHVQVDDAFGVALQAGVDIPISGDRTSVTLDAKRYFLRTDAHFYDASGAELLQTRHRLDPWVLSAGVAFRF
jgi:outer membrane protein